MYTALWLFIYILYSYTSKNGLNRIRGYIMQLNFLAEYTWNFAAIIYEETFRIRAEKTMPSKLLLYIYKSYSSLIRIFYNYHKLKKKKNYSNE
jgi:hypothetical protein